MGLTYADIVVAMSLALLHPPDARTRDLPPSPQRPSQRTAPQITKLAALLRGYEVGYL